MPNWRLHLYSRTSSYADIINTNGKVQLSNCSLASKKPGNPILSFQLLRALPRSLFYPSSAANSHCYCLSPYLVVTSHLDHFSLLMPLPLATHSNLSMLLPNDFSKMQICSCRSPAHDSVNPQCFNGKSDPTSNLPPAAPT